MSGPVLRQLRAEWTKFRTVRGWVIGLVAAALVTVVVGVLSAQTSHATCPDQRPDQPCTGPRAPGGQAVTDSFYFVHRTLADHGGLTVRVTSLTGSAAPWAKAGILVKAGTQQGSSYAALMVTAAHGVRLQHDFTHDTAGAPGAVSAASPRWLRLTRSGATLTGEESTDGTHWTAVGTARLTGLSSASAPAQAGLFTTSPPLTEASRQRYGGVNSTDQATRATGTFDHVALNGGATEGTWRGEQIGGDIAGETAGPSGYREQPDGTFTVSGTGDIAPNVGGPSAGGGETIERSLLGTFTGLIVVIVIGTTFITAEYRRGLIRTTLTASPRRGRALAAKAVVIGAVTFAAALPAAAAAVLLGKWLVRPNGFTFPVTALTQVRVIAGTAALLALCAVLALAAGAALRRSVAAVTAVFAATVVPYLLATGSILPEGPASWLLRTTPAAGFAIQQNMPRYGWVDSTYTPAFGYFPLPPWGGLAVLAAWTAAALGVAVVLLRRRDV
ncbi:ABC transporter permease subunit [Streptomyces sp. NPDC008139]|uniref:ABC transporter permease subunit n=1 Tax=Streptomyces sp. NPDC008139 TaxID=3364814 RepID=UPI0036E3D913